MTIDGGGGTDAAILNDAGVARTDTYTITSSTVSRPLFGGLTYSRLASLTLNGESGTSTAVSNIYNINSTAAGTSYKINGGGGNDTFNLSPTSSAGLDALQGPVTINGGGGSNTLDYSAWVGNVLVNLPLGTATGVAGGISNIQNVTGSIGNDILVGDANANVLVGGTGRNLIIGEGGPDQLFGGGDNILIGGTTAYDQNLTALDAIMAEFTRTDQNFHQRVSAIMIGGGFNGAFVLNTATLFDDGATNVLTGGGGLDWPSPT